MSAIGGEAAAVAQMQPPPQPQRQASAFSPASIGNVAVGFDILGHPLAGVGDTVTVRRIDAPQVRVAAIRGAPFALPCGPLIPLVSIAIMAASDRPSTTSASASPTLRTGRQIWSRASVTWASAASVKVPAGPR